MPRRRSIPPTLLLAVGLLTATVACREQTAPDEAGQERAARGPLPAIALPTWLTAPTIQSLSLATTKLALGAPSTPYVVTVRNPTGAPLPGVFLQGEVVQGTVTHGAGGFTVACRTPDGILPPGTCTMTFTVTASNATAGTGRLVEGPASFVLRLLRSDGVTTTELDVETVEVFLADPSAIAP